jgi:hypothetical protein
VESISRGTMARNAMSKPVMVSHVCEVHGEVIRAPVTYSAACSAVSVQKSTWLRGLQKRSTCIRTNPLNSFLLRQGSHGRKFKVFSTQRRASA